MECSPRNLPCSLPTDPHSPHACSTPRECTFSVTWTVLQLPISLTLGYRNRLDWKSPGSMAATGFLPGVLSFPVHSLTWRESLTGQQASRSPVLRSLNNPMGKQTQAFQKLDSAITGWLHSHGFGTGNVRIGSLSFPEQAKTLPRIQHRLLISWGYTHGISQNQTQTFKSQGLPKVLYRSRVSHTAQSSVRVQTIRWNGNGTFSRLTLAILFACTRVDTCHPWNCMCSTSTRSSHHLEIHVSFQKDLG
jgi:hypothetical protein